MQKITPFLWFDKNAEEAVNYYVDTFNNSPKSGKAQIVSITRYPDKVPDGPMKGMEGKILTVVFELNNQRFMALDGGPYFKFTEAISLYVNCADQEEVDYFWDKLGKGGDEKSQQCGWLKDKFGLSWQIVPDILGKYMSDPDKAKSGKVMNAVMQMKKLDIKQLKQAYES